MSKRRTGFGPVAVERITARSHGHCEIMLPVCTQQASTIHHRRPRGMGGTRKEDTNEVANGLAACAPCHTGVETLERGKARKWGFIVSQFADPASVPVWWRCAQKRHPAGGWTKAWVLLDNYGGMTETTTGEATNQ